MHNLMSSEVEASRDATNTYCRGIEGLASGLRPLRCSFDPAVLRLKMTTTLHAGIVFGFACVSAVLAQEPPATTPSAPPEESPALSTSEGSPAPSPVPEQTPSVLPGRSVRISFVPPPMEGTISLGINDKNGNLVRVLRNHAHLIKSAVAPQDDEPRGDGKTDADQHRPAA